MNAYKEHPLSQILPMMSETELNDLAKDIRENGLRAPIILLGGQILDGRNRYKACQIAKTVPRFQPLNGGGDPLAFIISANVHRRHLTESQRAMIAAKLETMKHGGKRPEQAAPTEKTRAQVAKELDVSPRSVATAKQVLKDAPKEEVEKIERGEKTVATVARETKAKTEKPKEQLDKTGYPIPESILHDWQRAADTAREMLSQVSGLRSQLKHALSESDLIFAEVTNSTIADLDNAYTSLKCVVPYAVCTSCQGHGRKKCSLCKGRGFISEFAWRSFVPSELKALRGKKK